MQQKIFYRRNLQPICILITLVLAFFPQISTAYEKEISSLSLAMAKKIADANKTIVATVDFTDLQGNVTEFGRFIAEEFSVAIASAGKGFKIVDRTHLQSILKEHKLSRTGLIDPKTARELGKITGVEALITGTITPFGESVRLTIKILDTTTAEIIDAQRGNIPKTQAIEELLGRGIEAGQSMTTSPSSRTPSIKSNTQQTFETKDFTFRLQGCRRSGKKVICHALAKNKNEKGSLNLYVFPESSITDELGNAYYAKQVQFGAKTSEKGGRDMGDKLFAGSSKAVFSIFEDVPSRVKIITMFAIKTHSFGVQFLNVPLSK